ncbi:MAG: D-alanine--D-alanine ligase [Desulfobacteraceae bacterium]|nr:D-alanine--D-alanine ligase [Desulfobacteraceae bacterium]
MRKLTVALLSGGKSSERDISINGGEQVFKALDKQKYDVIRYDPKFDLKRLIEDASIIDVALIIMHGLYGEDGTIQGLLDLLNIPYQGSGVLGSAVAMNKLASKHLYEKADLSIPPYIKVTRDESVSSDKFIESLGLPFVIKPVKSGSSIGMSIVKSKEEIKKALDDAFVHDNTVLAEKYIKGIELTCGVIGNHSIDALPVVEIIPDDEYEFFDFTAKYTKGATSEICPARIDDTMTEKVQSYAKKAHTALYCKGYSRTDMILDNKELYILETNTIPGMTPTSLMPLEAETAGMSYSQFLHKLIELSIG